MRINVYGGQNIDKRRVRRHFADIGIHGLPAKFRYVFIYGIQNLLAVKVRYPHQPLGGAQGQATEIEIAARHILQTKEKLNRMLAENTGKDISIIAADTDRDNWMSAEEAKEYGLIDRVIYKRSEA